MPDSTVLASRLKPVAGLEIWMTAPAMAAADGSVTIPVISPLIAADWPCATGWIVAAAPATKARSRILLGIEMLIVHFLFRGGAERTVNDSGDDESDPNHLLGIPRKCRR